jgi:hypothetical protein
MFSDENPSLAATVITNMASLSFFLCPYAFPFPCFIFMGASFVSIVLIVRFMIHSFPRPTMIPICYKSFPHSLLPLFSIVRELLVIRHSHGHSSST